MSGCFFEGGEDLNGFYEDCRSINDCVRSADACYTVDWLDGRGRMCSAYCERHADCPGDSSCWELVGDPAEQSICYGRCISSADCGFGFTCVDALSGETLLDSICLPRQ